MPIPKRFDAAGTGPGVNPVSPVMLMTGASSSPRVVIRKSVYESRDRSVQILVVLNARTFLPNRGSLSVVKSMLVPSKLVQRCGTK